MRLGWRKKYVLRPLIIDTYTIYIQIVIIQINNFYYSPFYLKLKLEINKHSLYCWNCKTDELTVITICTKVCNQPYRKSSERHSTGADVQKLRAKFTTRCHLNRTSSAKTCLSKGENKKLQLFKLLFRLLVN